MQPNQFSFKNYFNYNQYYIMSIYESFIQIDNKHILLDLDLSNLNIFNFCIKMNKRQYTLGDSYNKLLITFQKYIIQNIELINNDLPKIYIIYNIKYEKKYPVIYGFIISNSNFKESCYFNIMMGIKRLGGMLTLHINYDSLIDNLPTCILNELIQSKQEQMNLLYKLIENKTSILILGNTIDFHASKGEKECHKILSKNKNIKNILCQYTIETCSYINPLPFDFKIELKNNKNILIEYQGQQHYKPIEFWGGIQRYKEQCIKDKIKYDYCDKNNINLLIISYKMNIENTLNNYIENLVEKLENSYTLIENQQDVEINNTMEKFLI